jgi:hypothetical protein
MKKMEEAKKERGGDARGTRKSPYGIQPGSDQLATQELMLGPAIQGYGVLREGEEAPVKGQPRFGVQPSRTNLWTP